MYLYIHIYVYIIICMYIYIHTYIHVYIIYMARNPNADTWMVPYNIMDLESPPTSSQVAQPNRVRRVPWRNPRVSRRYGTVALFTYR